MYKRVTAITVYFIPLGEDCCWPAGLIRNRDPCLPPLCLTTGDKNGSVFKRLLDNKECKKQETERSQRHLCMSANEDTVGMTQSPQSCGICYHTDLSGTYFIGTI